VIWKRWTTHADFEMGITGADVGFPIDRRFSLVNDLARSCERILRFLGRTNLPDATRDLVSQKVARVLNNANETREGRRFGVDTATAATCVVTAANYLSRLARELAANGIQDERVIRQLDDEAHAPDTRRRRGGWFRIPPMRATTIWAAGPARLKSVPPPRALGFIADHQYPCSTSPPSRAHSLGIQRPVSWLEQPTVSTDGPQVAPKAGRLDRQRKTRLPEKGPLTWCFVQRQRTWCWSGRQDLNLRPLDAMKRRAGPPLP